MPRPARIGALAGWVLLAGGAPAVAQPAGEAVSAGPDTVSVTLYRGAAPAQMRYLPAWEGLGFITETRTVELPAGPVRLSLRGVADTLVPQSAQIEGLPGPVAESDFDYDLLSPGTLVAKALGQPVELVRTDPKSGRETRTAAVVRSGPQGVVLQTADGVEALHCGGGAERLEFEHAPPGLSDRPTLSARTVVPRAGRYQIKLSYLATGLNWSADYVARLAPDGRSLELSGWLTLRNASRTGFPDAPTQVVAGDLARTGDDHPVNVFPRALQQDCWPFAPWWKIMAEVGEVGEVREVMVTGSRISAFAFAKNSFAAAPAPPPPPPPPRQSELGDYKLYTLAEPTTVAAQQTKQVRFLDKGSVPAERYYAYEVAPAPADVARDTRAQIVLGLKNEAGRGLGLPLPAGHVALMAPGPDGRSLFLGGDEVRDTPVGQAFELKIGRAADVRVEATVASEAATASRPRQGVRPVRRTIEADLVNAGAEPAPVRLQQPQVPSLKILSEDAPHALRNGKVEWTVVVPPHARRTFHYAYSAL